MPERQHPEALAEVEALARQMREANPKLTNQQAYKRALEQHPEAYAKYLGKG